jgi:hypothetical protein
MTGGSGIPVKKQKIGKNQNANRLFAKQLEYVQKTYYLRYSQMSKKRYTPEELHARLVVTIGVLLALVFAGSIFALLYALVFVTQPMAQAPNDAQFIDLISTLSVFLTGTLSGIVSANGLKNKIKEGEKPKDELN